MKKEFLLLFLLFWGGLSRAATGPGVAGSPLLAQPVGARPLSLGASYTALSDDSLATLWNPAGLVSLRFSEAGFIFDQSPGGVNYGHLLYAKPVSAGQGIGLGLGMLQVEDVDYHDLSGNLNYLAGQSDWVMAASYAVSLKPLLAFPDPASVNVSGGLTVKYLWTKLGGGLNARTPAVDLGLLASLPFPGAPLPTRLGVSWQNMGGQVKYGKEADPVASPVRVGIAQTIPENSGAWLTATVEGVRYLARNEVEMHMGIEQVFKPAGSVGLAVRCGYRMNTDLPGVSAGAGIRWSNFILDYGMAQLGVLGFVHRVGLRIELGE